MLKRHLHYFPAKEETVEEDETRVEKAVCRINTNISLLECCNCDLASLLKDLKGEEKAKEEKEHQKASEGSDGYIEMLLDANKVVARLQTRLKVIARRKEQSCTRDSLETTTLKTNEKT